MSKFTIQEAREVRDELRARSRGADEPMLGLASEVIDAFLAERVTADESKRGTPADWLDEL